MPNSTRLAGASITDSVTGACVGLRGIGVKRCLHAGEVARGKQTAHIVVEHLRAIDVARLKVGEIAHEALGILVESAHVHDAEVEHRAAGKHHRQRSALRGGIDARFARGECRRGKRARRQRGHRARLGRRPQRLAERRIDRKQPFVANARENRRTGRRVAGRSGDIDRHRGNARRRPRRDAKRDGRGCGRAVDGKIDLGGEEPLRGRGFAGLGRRVAGEAVEQVLGHVREILPAHDIHRAADRRFDLRRPNDRYGIAKCSGIRISVRVGGCSSVRRGSGRRRSICRRGRRCRRGGRSLRGRCRRHIRRGGCGSLGVSCGRKSGRCGERQREKPQSSPERAIGRKQHNSHYRRRARVPILEVRPARSSNSATDR